MFIVHVSIILETRMKIQTLLDEGQGVREIARKFGVGRSTVQWWKNRESSNVENQPGRPTIPSPTTGEYDKKPLYRKLRSFTKKCVEAL